MPNGDVVSSSSATRIRRGSRAACSDSRARCR